MGEATAGSDGAEFVRLMFVSGYPKSLFFKKEKREIGNNRCDIDRAKAEKLSNFYQFLGMHRFGS